MPVRDTFDVDSFYFIKNTSKRAKVLRRNSVDFEKFLEIIISYLLEFEQIAILAYVVLPDQFQFLIKNAEKGYVLSYFLRKTQISYAMYYKKKYPNEIIKGEPVFPNRFISRKILTELELNKTLEDISLAPIKNKIVKKISDRPYTSAHQLMKTGYKRKKETHIRVLG